MECYYGEMKMGLAMACRECSIPCVEYQHGFQEWPHVPYNFPHVPKEGWSCVPEWFLHWDEGSSRRMGRYFANQDFHRCAVAGKPALIAWRRGLTRDAEREERLDAILSGRVPIGVALPVAVHEGDERLNDLLDAAIGASPSEWSWLLRRHPVNRNPWATGEEMAARHPGRTETEICGSISVHAFLDRCRHLVTGYSTTAVEARMFHGVPATCIHPAARLFLGDHIRLGSMSYADSADALLRSISAGLDSPPSPGAAAGEERMIAAFARVLAHEVNSGRRHDNG